MRSVIPNTLRVFRYSRVTCDYIAAIQCRMVNAPLPMPAERLSMRKVREVLRLKHTLGMSLRQISEATGVGKTVVGEYVRRAGVIGITNRFVNEAMAGNRACLSSGARVVPT
jgi:hypothetical protein